jgi:hypothetical protein
LGRSAKEKKHGTIISVHEVVKGGTNNAAGFMGIIQARCQTARIIKSRNTLSRQIVCVFKPPVFKPYTSRLVLPHRGSICRLNRIN